MSNGRKVSTDALETLGTIIDENQKRDAIHIAVLPVRAGRTLKPGEDIGIEDGLATTVDEPTGIVDPFLKANVKKGQMFWMLLYPRMVTSLRHVWSHPAFEGDNQPVTAKPTKRDPEIQRSQTWIQNWADDNDVDYDVLMQGAKSYLSRGEYLCEGGRWEGTHLDEEFWDHYEIVTGDTVKEDKRSSFFSCSC